MLSVETTLTFFIASVLLGIAPGPDNIYVLTQSALRGKLSGLSVMLGLCTGLTVHTIAVAFGVAMIFKTSIIAFTVLKFTGAIYLLYLAWQVFKTPVNQSGSGPSEAVNFRTLYFRGIIMNITNPKVSVFFLAFLPQFADPANGNISIQMLLLGGLFIIATLLVFGSIVVIGSTIGQFLYRSAYAQKILNKLSGAVFICLALKLATAKR